MTLTAGVAADPATGAVDWARRLDRLRRQRVLVPGNAIPPPGVRRAAPDEGSLDRARRLAEAFGGVAEDGPGGAVVRIRDVRHVSRPSDRLASLPWPVDPARPLVCLDTETTGLGSAAGTVVFLVGLGTWTNDSFVVEQLLLPDHPDEPALLAALTDAVPGGAWLVTYNGRSFDWPLLSTRYRLHGDPPPALDGHLDLLPVARQLWKHRLDDARLATVEAGVVGVRRHDDLPGALIPARYLDYLRSGRPEPLSDVLRHNAQDVVSLGLLLAHLAHRLADPELRRAEHPGDLAALGRAYARRRRFDEAVACCDAAHGSGGGGAGAVVHGAVARGDVASPEQVRWWFVDRDRIAADRARVLRMAGRREAAREAWHDLARGDGRLAAHAWVQVAKHDEHVRRDPAGALVAAERAMKLVERDRFFGRAPGGLERDLPRRLARLRRRVARCEAARSAAARPARPPPAA